MKKKLFIVSAIIILFVVLLIVLVSDLLSIRIKAEATVGYKIIFNDISNLKMEVTLYSPKYQIQNPKKTIIEDQETLYKIASYIGKQDLRWIPNRRSTRYESGHTSYNIYFFTKDENKTIGQITIQDNEITIHPFDGYEILYEKYFVLSEYNWEEGIELQ